MKILNILKRGELHCVILFASIYFAIYPTEFPLSFQVGARTIEGSDVIAEFFHIPEVFDMDYMEMERNFKIYVYPHNATLCDEQMKLHGDDGNEGLFFENLKRSRFLTKDPEKAHLFLVPTSCHSLPAEGISEDDRAIAVEDLVKGLISKYPYWNRTLGADHFFITCTDIHVIATKRISNLMKNSMRVMCSPSYDDQEYVPHKDVSIPQSVQPLGFSGSANSAKRNILAYWKGLNNSPIRETLLHAWENDSELHIEQITSHNSTDNADFYTSKFCICAGGPHVDRYIAFSIHYGCVPGYFPLPFIDILEWKKFSVILNEGQIYELKVILEGILDQEYQALKTNIAKVQAHFRWKLPAVRLDAFHMVMYDLWQRRHVTKYYE